MTPLYANVLCRTRRPDAGNYAVQLTAVNSGMSGVQLLVNFSESTEKYNATIIGLQSSIEHPPFALITPTAQDRRPKVADASLCIGFNSLPAGSVMQSLHHPGCT